MFGFRNFVDNAAQNINVEEIPFYGETPVEGKNGMLFPYLVGAGVGAGLGTGAVWATKQLTNHGLAPYAIGGGVGIAATLALNKFLEDHYSQPTPTTLS